MTRPDQIRTEQNREKEAFAVLTGVILRHFSRIKAEISTFILKRPIQQHLSLNTSKYSSTVRRPLIPSPDPLEIPTFQLALEGAAQLPSASPNSGLPRAISATFKGFATGANCSQTCCYAAKPPPYSHLVATHPPEFRQTAAEVRKIPTSGG
jgi:hypothetical protein